MYFDWLKLEVFTEKGLIKVSIQKNGNTNEITLVKDFHKLLHMTEFEISGNWIEKCDLRSSPISVEVQHICFFILKLIHEFHINF